VAAVAGHDVGFGVARMARRIADPTNAAPFATVDGSLEAARNAWRIACQRKAAPFVTREVTLGAVASRARRTACQTSPAAPAAQEATFGAAAWMAPRIPCQRNAAAVAIHAATFGAARRARYDPDRRRAGARLVGREVAVARISIAGSCPADLPPSSGVSGFMPFQPLKTR
jgi:hypothetical protein